MSATMTEQYVADSARSAPRPVPTTIKTSMIYPGPSSYSKSTTSTNPSLEEDESNDTSSEPLEPLTPATSVPLTNPFESYNKPNFEAPSHMPPPPSPTTVEPRDPAPAAPKADSATPQSKQSLKKRATTFFKNHLTRTSSNTSDDLSNQNYPALTPQKSAPAMRPKQKAPPVKTNVQSPSPQSAPSRSLDASSNPKIRRFSSWSLSAARSSPRSSQSNSPPTPGSPSSTIPSETHKGSPPKSNPVPPAPRLTWAGQLGNTKIKKTGPRYQRRRSASTDQVPRLGVVEDDDDPTVGLMGTFSKPAMQGAGLKARRLSTSLPNEFWVDHCELEKEFKSSSFVPGKRGRRCGKGATAEVRIMTRRQTTSEDLVAVKEFRQRDSHEDEHDYIQKIKSEYSIAKSLHHPNIVETVRLCTSQGRWNHVMEYANHGELFALVDRGLFKTHYKLQDRLCFFKQMLQGIDYLHSHGIAHRDIKLENLLLDKNGHIRITDFGVSEVFSGEHPGLRAAAGECGKNMGAVRKCSPGICGSLPYIAPEVLAKKDDYDPRPLDVWSCAIAFLTMTFGGSPWQAAQPSHPHYARYKKGWDEWLPNHPDAEIKDEVDGYPKCGPLFNYLDSPAIKRLMLKMLHPIPEKRITISEVLNSSYVKKIECCCPDTYEDTTKCCINAATKKGSTKIMVRPKHHHIPPKPESKVKQAMQHRFDMGDGY